MKREKPPEGYFAPFAEMGEAWAPSEYVQRGGAAGFSPDSLPKRTDLLLIEWLTREIPPRDYLLGNVLCTTSRWMIYGETGVGKTLFAAELAGAVSAGASMFNWAGHRSARVMYLDGELPAETFKERMEIVADRFGEGLDLFGYCRDVLADGDMPPLNTPKGEAWLKREIQLIKPDLIVFDSIMCLLSGSMSEEESWEPIKPLIRFLSSRRIAQIWLHHTGHDNTKAFGSKTKEWELDTVISLTKPPDDEEGVALEFKKARLRTPRTADEFASRLIRREAHGWVAEGNVVSFKGGRRSIEAENVKRAFLRAYDKLAKATDETLDEEGDPIRQVAYAAVVEEVKNTGFLELNEKGAVSATSRTQLRRAKLELLTSDILVENGGLVWRPVIILSGRKR